MSLFYMCTYKMYQFFYLFYGLFTLDCRTFPKSDLWFSAFYVPIQRRASRAGTLNLARPSGCQRRTGFISTTWVTWGSSHLQPKARFFSAICHRHIAGTSPGIRTRQLTICRLTICLGATTGSYVSVFDFFSTKTKMQLCVTSSNIQN